MFSHIGWDVKLTWEETDSRVVCAYLLKFYSLPHGTVLDETFSLKNNQYLSLFHDNLSFPIGFRKKNMTFKEYFKLFDHMEKKYTYKSMLALDAFVGGLCICVAVYYTLSKCEILIDVSR